MRSSGMPIPLYYQLRSIILTKIETGEWAEGSPIPGERELERLYGLSRTPVRQAIGELVSEGILERRHGKGTFVAPHKIKQVATRMIGLVEGLKLRGLDPQIEVQDFRLAEVTKEIAEALQMEAATAALYLCRRIHVNETPLILDETYLNRDMAPFVSREGVLTTPLFELMERNGVSVTGGAQSFTAVCLDTRRAALLGVPTGTASLVIKTLVSGLNGIPIMYTLSFCRADRYEPEIALRR